MDRFLLTFVWGDLKKEGEVSKMKTSIQTANKHIGSQKTDVIKPKSRVKQLQKPTKKKKRKEKKHAESFFSRKLSSLNKQKHRRKSCPYGQVPNFCQSEYFNLYTKLPLLHLQFSKHQWKQ